MSYQALPFLDVFEDASGGNIKTPQKYFLEEGEIPVVDQGKELIAGYVNDRERVCKAKPPVIVFGDHTKAIKYVDFEFAMGADGTKVLVPKLDSDPKYLFYVLQTLHIPDAGYSRHYKFLKESVIPLPPLEEQKRIAGILDAADALRARRRKTLVQLDTLLQSTFLDMFGDPVTNPRGWDQCRIDEIFDVARGGSPRPIQNYLTESADGLNWIMIGDASSDSRYITSVKKRIKPEGLKKTREVHAGDFLLTNSMSFGRPYILKTDGCIHDGWLVLSPKDKRMAADYFYSLLSTEALYREFSRRAAGAVVKNLNTKLVSQVSVAVPPFELQEKFVVIVEAVEKQKARLQSHLNELDALFTSLQSRAFNGEL